MISAEGQLLSDPAEKLWSTNSPQSKSHLGAKGLLCVPLAELGPGACVCMCVQPLIKGRSFLTKGSFPERGRFMSYHPILLAAGGWVHWQGKGTWTGDQEETLWFSLHGCRKTDRKIRVCVCVCVCERVRDREIHCHKLDKNYFILSLAKDLACPLSPFTA